MLLNSTQSSDDADSSQFSEAGITVPNIYLFIVPCSLLSIFLSISSRVSELNRMKNSELPPISTVSLVKGDIYRHKETWHRLMAQ
ncbi:hypothetical protein H6G74_28020 [Nostoc spongiaeforme FACHB-130]|uniref:Uncharacterized protein n=1 Tax=Nostoc spongiaeforme FACHB-130 TaxID=1357510 RepID=A0ABR8G4E5_9NOSO|nr:hypothetical protein [Nostoc spongiaeforme]MBD2598143.1 hypothetical protein [Nostoc spongiaeforme FACHB-130]